MGGTGAPRHMQWHPQSPRNPTEVALGGHEVWLSIPSGEAYHLDGLDTSAPGEGENRKRWGAGDIPLKGLQHSRLVLLPRGRG